MTLASKIVTGVVAVAVVGACAAAVFAGGFPTSRDTHPPCENLPTRAEATAALTRNQALAADIEAVGAVTVAVGMPCPEGQDRALVQVTYETGSDQQAIGDLLDRRDGFGVPVYLAEK